MKRAPVAHNTTVQGGRSCTLITFEGLADTAPIPTIEGISFPGWLSVTDEPLGTGHTSNDPSGLTTAFWLDAATSHDILLTNPASNVSFLYSSAVPVTLTAYDAAGNSLGTVQGVPNYDSSTRLYDIWTPIGLQVTGNKIQKLTVAGATNYTVFDNLNVCGVIGIDSVEVTQAIQQFQKLGDLKASLQASQEPPVPIISGKPAVLRVYFDEVDSVGTVNLQVSGAVNFFKSMPLTPNCDASKQRDQEDGCQSMDFYFTPPSGSWQVQLDVVDNQGNTLEEEILPFKSRDTNSVRLRAVSVCDKPSTPWVYAGPWTCADPGVLLNLTGLAAKIFPTNSVTADSPYIILKKDLTVYPTGLIDDWWDEVARLVAANWGRFDRAGDSLAGRRTTYFGMVRGDLPGDTMGNAFPGPSHGAAGRVSAIDMGVEENVETVAHEYGHTLGLRHTNTNAPKATSVPGCDLQAAADNGTDYPFPDNYIRSNAGFETGFDVAAHKVVDPITFEIMGYCMPQWITPFSYKKAISTLGGGAVTTPSAVDRPAVSHAQPAAGWNTAANAGPFWLVAGVIAASGVQFDPLFQLTLQGDTDAESGTYTMVEQSAAGQALFTRNFTPAAPQVETRGVYTLGTPGFSELLPVEAGVAAIVLKDPGANEIGRITLGGNAPVVAITAPAAGFVGMGQQTVSWTVQGPASFTAKLLYSPDNGVTWSELGDLPNAASEVVDFSRLPGSAKALIQVLVSDGVNTGSATSVSFTVARHLPGAVVIQSPNDGSAQPAADPVHLSGAAFDMDDGVLSGAALQWTSSLQGPLGSGAALDLKLQPGAHRITLTATDSDGNSIATGINVVIGGQPPTVSLQVQAVDQAPTTCENVTIGASPGAGGASLSQAQYSLDGGVSYTNIPLSKLPYQFTVPGSGYFHLVARASDVSGQADAQDSIFFTTAACAALLPAVASVNQNQGFQGQNVPSVAISARNTNFAQGTTVANFGAGITVNSLTVAGPASATANITIAGNAALGTYPVTMTTGTEVASISSGFTVIAGFPLAINVSPAGSGTIVRSPWFGTDYYPSGYSVQLTASPVRGYAFTGFSGDLTGNANPQTLVMSAAHNVTAVFTLVPSLSISVSRAAHFTQGQNGATYTVTVTNAASAGPASGTVSVTEIAPSGLSLASMAGTGWTCPAGSGACTRSDALAPGASYPDVTITFSVLANAPAQVTNEVKVSGGGSAAVDLQDPMTIAAGNPYDLNGDGALNVADVQVIVNEALGVVKAVHDLNGDGVVNVVDVQKEINAVLGRS